MKILKTIGITILVILALLVIGALFLPSHSHLERSVVMKADPANIFNEVNTLKNWESWSPWHKLDPNMKLTYEGPESGKGAKYIWKSDKKDVGSGSLWIVDSKPDSFVQNTMEFDGMGQSASAFKIEKTADGTKVTWSMDSKCEGLPWYMYVPSKWMGLFMDGMVGPDFEKGLNSIKEITEKMPPAASLPEVKMDEVETKAQKMLTINIKCKKEEIQKKFGEAMGKLNAYAMKNHAKMTGPAFEINHAWKDVFDVDAGIPIDKKIPSSGDIKYSEMKPGKALKAVYWGDYMKMEPTYMAIMKWMKDNNKKATGDSWEVYMTDPMKERDTAKWQTEIYFPQ